MKRILVIGDSISSARIGGTDSDAGWPALMGIDESLRQGVYGSTAAQWNSNWEGRLSSALATSREMVILSLMANDMSAALRDGNITDEEFEAAIANMRSVVSAFTWNRAHQRIIVLEYTDAFFGTNPQWASGVPMVNGAIRAACAGLPTVEFFETSSVLKPEHYNGSDMHPILSGHEVLAAALTTLITQ